MAPRRHQHCDALILSACRTPIGSFGGASRIVSAADLGATVDSRGHRARARGARRASATSIMGCVLQAGAGMNVARQAALKAGHAGRGARGNRQPRLRIRTSGGRARRRGDPRRLRRHDGGRRHRVDVERAVSAEGRAVGLSAWATARRSTRCWPRGSRARSTRATWASPPRKSPRATASRAPIRTRSRPRASSAPVAGDCATAASRRRSCLSTCRRRRASRCAIDDGRIPARRTRRSRSSPRCKPAFKKDGSVTAGNASGINDGAAALVVDDRRARRAKARHAAARADPVVRDGRRRSDDHGHRPGAGRPPGARPRRPRDRPTSISSS